jgi:hypothetical protein
MKNVNYVIHNLPFYKRIGVKYNGFHNHKIREDCESCLRGQHRPFRHEEWANGLVATHFAHHVDW